MLSREEYERVIEIFLVELCHLCSDVTESELQSSPQLSRVIDDYLTDLRDPTNDASTVLRYAFGYLDEYCAAKRDQVLTAGYDAYKIWQSQIDK